MVTENVKMKQHYVPRVYLKQFENSGKLLWMMPNHFHKYSPRVREVSRGQVCYEHDFYTITNPSSLIRLGQTDKNIIEKVFNARVENRYGKLITKLLKPGSVISYKEAEEILKVLFSFKQRNPVFRQALHNPEFTMKLFNKRLNEIVAHRATLSDILEKEGSMNFDQFIEYGRNYMYKFAQDPNSSRQIHTEGIVKFYRDEDGAVKQIINGLMAYEWHILESKPAFPFITSDNPGFCIDTKEKIHNLNFGDIYCFCFPFTPIHSLMISAEFKNKYIRQKQIHSLKAGPELVKIINRGTFQVSYKNVLGNDVSTLKNIWHDMIQFKPSLKKSDNSSPTS